MYSLINLFGNLDLSSRMKRQKMMYLGVLAILFLTHQSHAQTAGSTSTLFELLQQSERLQQQQQQQPWMYQVSQQPTPISYNARPTSPYAYRQPMWLMYYWIMDNM